MSENVTWNFIPSVHTNMNMIYWII